MHFVDFEFLKSAKHEKEFETVDKNKLVQYIIYSIDIIKLIITNMPNSIQQTNLVSTRYFPQVY